MDKFFMVLVALIVSALGVSVSNFAKNSSQAHTLGAAQVILGHGKTIKEQRSYKHVRQPAIVKNK